MTFYSSSFTEEEAEELFEEYGPDPEPEPEQEEPWEEPVPLYEYNLPAFPTGVHPPWIKNYVEELARTTQTPEDLAGMLIPAVCATALSKKFVIEMRPGWKEPLNIYSMVVLPSGERKSPVFEDCIEPIQEYERTQVEFLRPEIQELKAQKDILEGRLKNEKSTASKGSTLEAKEAEENAIKLSKEYSEFEVPELPKFIVDDISPERLASVLAEQRGKISVLSSEGGIFEIVAGRYSQNSNPNIEALLKGYSGDLLKVDRQGDKRQDCVERPAITIGLTVQPDVLRGLLGKPGFRGRGFLARFLYSIPLSRVGTRNTKPMPRSATVKDTYNHYVKKLMGLPYGSEKEPFVLKLSPGAERVSDDFAEWLEPQLAPGGELELVKDWGSKLHGTIGRIAGLLHNTETIDNPSPWEIPVSEDTFKKAVSLGIYLIEHAKAAFMEMGADESLDDSRYILRWIDRGSLDSFTKREAHNALQGRFKTVESLEKALNILSDHGYIREENPSERKGPGRKPSPIFKVNPTRTQYTQYTQYKDEVNSVDSVYSVHREEEKNNHWQMEF